ncbi:MAG: hypothetical protein PHQ40_00475 [Anaerolineaceae bacterium]|nr:hypothetical protein [Anaerolineaceae bacterium]MDD5367531.1 hypothetical protein [Anaerolineaceae bacterium]
MKKDKRLLRIQRLHLFSNGTDTHVAFDKLDAVEVWKEMTGEKEYDYDEFELVPDSTIVKIGCEPDTFDEMKKSRPLFSKLNPDTEYPTVSAPAWMWALQNGRGYLCGPEW